jgi:hypothetical protein
MRWQKPWLRGCWISTAVCCHCMCCKTLIAWIGRTPIPSLRGSEALLLFRCGGCTCKVIRSALKFQLYSVQQDIYLAQKSVGCILYTGSVWRSQCYWQYLHSLLVITHAPRSVTTSLVRTVKLFNKIMGAHCGTVGWCSVLLARRSLVWLLMVSSEFLIDIILLAALWPCGLLSLWQK